MGNQHAQSQPRSARSLHEGLVRVNRHNSLDDVYEILESIGQGGLCSIYKLRKREDRIGGSSRPQHVRSATARRILLARKNHRDELDCSTPLYFALKVINLALVEHDKLDQLKNEIEILKGLDHKNIIKAYETYQRHKQLEIVMELCTGGDLLARLPYTDAQASYVVQQILSALSYLHDNNIAHRDLKVENILFESDHPDAAIKVIDFGLSKEYSPSNHILTERVGTLYSMSPETLQGIYTFQADVWSLGVVTYMLLANGQKPFDGQTPKQVVAKILRGDYTLPEGTSSDAQSFLQSLLVVQADQRLTASQAKQHAWVQQKESRHGFHRSISSGVDESFKQRVRESMIQYANMGDFRKLALNIIAKKSTSDEIFQLRKVFDEFDTLQTGTLTMTEFQQALAQFDYSEEDVQQIFHRIDVNRNNVINYTEFLAAALETQGNIAEYRLAEAFDQMDSDDSGFISKSNIRSLLGEAGSDKKYIDHILAGADFSKNGQISYEGTCVACVGVTVAVWLCSGDRSVYSSPSFTDP